LIDKPLTPGQRHALIELAQRAVRRAATAGGGSDGDGDNGDADGDGDPGTAPEGLSEPGAAFVTLRVRGALKGCIGSFEPRASLWNTVHEMATAAATRDSRFAPVSPEDLRALGVEISVLSPPSRVTGPADIEIGRHGLEVRRGTSRGLLLPQVATDHGLDRESFLGETCRKAGLATDAWRQPGTEIHVFEADVFGDTP
jgi:AmmeMemoRadiSam system protein A